jgi:hypothetical protein
VNSVSFPKNGDAEIASTDDTGPDSSEPTDTAQNTKKLTQTRQAEPDIRPDPDSGRTSRNPLRGFFNLFKSKPKQATGAQSTEDKKKHHFLFF